jgi:hypothetical protein
MGNLMRFILNVWPRVNQEHALFFIHQGRVIPPALAEPLDAFRFE